MYDERLNDKMNSQPANVAASAVERLVKYFLCGAGIHKYKTAIIWRSKAKYSCCYLEGDKCQRCQHIRTAHKKQADELGNHTSQLGLDT